MSMADFTPDLSGVLVARRPPEAPMAATCCRPSRHRWQKGSWWAEAQYWIATRMQGAARLR